MKTILLLIGFLIFSGCTNSPAVLEKEEKAEFLISGDSISKNAQAILLQNVSQAMKVGGVVNAVDFCSEKAITITDSLSNYYAKDIHRLSDKNRNPANAIKSDLDQKAWEQIKSFLSDSAMAKHLILQDQNNVYYYKAITIGMPTCLKCHGDKTLDINSEALAMIKQKYPADKATGYKMGELRGMWKVKLK